MSSPYHHILRIYLPPDKLEARTNDVLNYCRRTGAQEVLLFTTSYDTEPTFTSVGEIEKYLALIEPQIARLRAAGLVVSINVMQTLGHIYFPRALQKQFPFQRRVYADGQESLEGGCPLCPGLRKWAAESYAAYARVRPHVLLVDDDFRTIMQGLSCFCEPHLAAIGKIFGRPVTREEIVDALHPHDDRTQPLREAYWEATTEGFASLAGLLHDAVKKVSPATRLGVMTATWPYGSTGIDWDRTARALCGDDIPIIRPQDGTYSECFLHDLPRTALNADRFRASLRTEIEYWPEIENYQYGEHAKSARMTFIQMAAKILQGFDHLALNIFDFFGSPFSESERTVALIEEKRPFLDALHAAVPEGYRPAGIRIAMHPRSPIVRRLPAGSRDLHEGRQWADYLPNLGLPISHVASDWNFILSDDVRAFSDAELDALLKSGAVLDLRAAEALVDRGLGDRIGVFIGEPINVDDLGYEDFHDAEFNPRYHAHQFPMRALVHQAVWKKLGDRTGKGRAASLIRNYKQEQIAPAILLTENCPGRTLRRLRLERRLRPLPDRKSHARRAIARGLLLDREEAAALLALARRPLSLAHPQPHR